MTAGISLNHVALSVTDNARATRFYTEVLGLTELPRPDFGIPGSWLSAGAAMVHLAQIPSIPEPRDPVAHFALTVATERIGPLVDAVRSGGGTVITEPKTRDQLGVPVTSAICCDTEGNRFEITDAS